MTKILVGIDGTERGERAVEWAARYGAREGASLKLIAVVDPNQARAFGIDRQTGDSAIDEILQVSKAKVIGRYPQAQVETAIAVGKIVDCLVDAADGCDMIVMGSHHGASVGETVGGAKGLRVSVSVEVPTVVIPSDWDQDSRNHRIVVGVGADESSINAVQFAARETIADGEQLDLVSGWGLPALLTKPAEAMGGGLDPVGEQYQRNLDQLAEKLKAENEGLDVVAHAVEGSSPTKAILNYAKDAKLLVLGTHSRTALGRTLFGSVTHSVLLNLCVPTVIVPQK